MNSTLKPVQSQNASSATPNKPMHPQGAPMSYGQPSGPISQNPFPNTNMAHNHPTTQQNHYSLNVPGGGTPFNMGTIPASNHPVAISQPTSGQSYNPPKNVSYSSGFQHGINTQNQNTLPPVSQTLPATTSTTPAVVQSSPTSQNMLNSNSSSPPAKESPVEKEKPQPNGTTEVESPAPTKTEKSEIQGNHVSPPRTVTPTQVSQPLENKPSPQTSSPLQTSTEKPNPSQPTSEKKSVEEVKPVPETTQAAKEPLKVSEESTPTPIVAKPAAVPAPEVVSKTTAVVPEAAPAASSEQSTEPDQTQNDSENPKDNQESDPLALETSAATEEKPVQDQNKSIPVIEADEPKEENEKSFSEEEQSSEEASDSERNQKTENLPAKTPARKTKVVKQTESKTPVQKSPSSGKTKRQRMRTQHYQSPLPEIEIITKITSTPTRSRNNDDKLIYFYKNEFLAVRNADGGFYLCQAVQNIYKSSSKIKIRWLSQDKSDKSGEIYTPDFYDLTDFDCILTSLDLKRVGKGRYRLKPAEKLRTDSILKRCLAVEKGEISQPSVSEEHPDGLDLSLYKDEEQLKKKKKGIKRKIRPRSESPKKDTPTKKSPAAPKVRKVDPKSSTTNTVAIKKKIYKKPAAPAPEPKKTTPTTSRAARGKRKGDPKTSPVVDQKKAKVLAKIGRKAGIPASSSKPQTSKSAKVSKSAPSTSKVTKSAPPSKSRKAKKVARKY